MTERAYFGTDGIRRHRVVIGKDTRLSGYMLENALVAGFTAVGHGRVPASARCRRRPSPC
jgi:phosphomannomutase